MNDASNHATQFTFDGRFKASPDFSKGADEIVFVVLDNPMLMRLMRLTLSDDGAGFQIPHPTRP